MIHAMIFHAAISISISDRHGLRGAMLLSVDFERHITP